MTAREVVFVGTYSGQECGEYACNRKAVEALLESGSDVKIIDTNLVGEDFGSVGAFSFGKLLKIVFSYIKLVFFMPSVDVVYLTPGMTKLGLISVLPYVVVSKLFRKKLVFHYHGFKIFFTFDGLSAPLKKIVRYVLSGVDCHIFLSNSHAAAARDRFGEINCLVIPNFVDESFSCHVRDDAKSLRSIDGEVKFLYLSNLIPEKGVYEAVESIKLLREKFGHNVRLDVVGGLSKNEEKVFLEKISVVEGVDYLGVLTGIDKAEAYMSADAFIFPSYYKQEAFPLVIVEAMAAGLAIFATKIGCIPEVVTDRQEGRLLDSHLPCRVAALISSELNIGLESYKKAAKAKSLQFTEAAFKKSIVSTIKRI